MVYIQRKTRTESFLPCPSGSRSQHNSSSPEQEPAIQARKPQQRAELQINMLQVEAYIYIYISHLTQGSKMGAYHGQGQDQKNENSNRFTGHGHCSLPSGTQLRSTRPASRPPLFSESSWDTQLPKRSLINRTFRAGHR